MDKNLIDSINKALENNSDFKEMTLLTLESAKEVLEIYRGLESGYIETKQKLDDEISKFEDKTQAVKDMIDSFQESAELTLEQVLEAQKLVESIKADIEAFDIKFQEIQKQINEDKLATEGYKDEASKLVEEAENIKSQVLLDNEETLKEVDSKKDEITSIVSQANSDLDTKIENANNELDTKVASVNSEFDTKVATANSDLDTKVEGINTDLDSKIASANTDLDNKIATTNTDLDSQKDTFTALVTQANTALDTKVEGINTDLDTKVASVNSEFDTKVENVNNDLDTKVAGINTDLDSKIASANTDIDTKVDKFKSQDGIIFKQTKGDGGAIVSANNAQGIISYNLNSDVDVDKVAWFDERSDSMLALQPEVKSQTIMMFDESLMLINTNPLKPLGEPNPESKQNALTLGKDNASLTSLHTNDTGVNQASLNLEEDKVKLSVLKVGEEDKGASFSMSKEAISLNTQEQISLNAPKIGFNTPELYVNDGKAIRKVLLDGDATKMEALESKFNPAPFTEEEKQAQQEQYEKEMKEFEEHQAQLVQEYYKLKPKYDSMFPDYPLEDQPSSYFFKLNFKFSEEEKKEEIKNNAYNFLVDLSNYAQKRYLQKISGKIASRLNEIHKKTNAILKNNIYNTDYDADSRADIMISSLSAMSSYAPTDALREEAQDTINEFWAESENFADTNFPMPEKKYPPVLPFEFIEPVIFEKNTKNGIFSITNPQGSIKIGREDYGIGIYDEVVKIGTGLNSHINIGGDNSELLFNGKSFVFNGREVSLK